MSTNFYWLHDAPSKVRLATGEEFDVNFSLDYDIRVHIGKRFGTRTGLGFTWAQKPEEVRKHCVTWSHLKLVRNEYEETFTGKEFLALIDGMAHQEMNMIGRSFS